MVGRDSGTVSCEKAHVNAESSERQICVEEGMPRERMIYGRGTDWRGAGTWKRASRLFVCARVLE